MSAKRGGVRVWGSGLRSSLGAQTLTPTTHQSTLAPVRVLGSGVG